MQEDPDQAEKEDDKASTGEYPASISISLVTLKITQMRWKRLNQQRKVLRHWNLRQFLRK